ncbi:MAG: efflux RND transporter periplasmic adaptor subunit [Idiomarina sp.]|nr:efflux RND transporter periplasmic adaptor subunit [Idiomarina sp.]
MNLMKLLFPSAMPRWSSGLVVLAGVTLLSACSAESSEPAAQVPGTAVTVALVETGDAVQYGEYAARVQSLGTVELRAQVSGILQERLYLEGQHVEQGAALFQIDPEPYALAQQRAEAELAEVRAAHANAQREWDRQQDLFARQVTSEHDKDQAETNLQAVTARLHKAEVAKSDAQRLLDYAQVKAPVAGMVGLETHAAGNLIEAGTLLATITPLDTIHILFTLPARDANLHRNALASGSDSPVQTRLRLEGGRVFEHAGELNFTDARINPRTDSIQMRAVFPNPKGALLPGQFVRLVFPLQAFTQVVLIDPKAVSEGPDGPQVFTVTNGVEPEQHTAHARSVELGPVIDGMQVIAAGLDAGDQLVVNGQVSLRPGRPVRVVEIAPSFMHKQAGL